ncbi:hypothetical protein ES319_D05G147300v1 [Gossypium barbadense]|uniref:Uncharacterized protein n=1 Tax=Gossypium barbadense TaxID=3634 RepID=A0A5J5RD53_GOSBA|nr:hypothetical protein ES319_D05G147300v1 [Gossypium barbadense]
MVERGAEAEAGTRWIAILYPQKIRPSCCPWRPINEKIQEEVERDIKKGKEVKKDQEERGGEKDRFPSEDPPYCNK